MSRAVPGVVGASVRSFRRPNLEAMQQRTSVLPAGHPVKAMTGLARQIALPHEHSPLRFPSFPSLERTAVMGFNAPANLSLPAGTAVKVMLSRQATYPAWAERVLTKDCYLMTFTTSAPQRRAGSNFDNTLLINPSPIGWGRGLYAGSAYSPSIGTGGTQVPVGDMTYPIVGVDGDQAPYIWCPQGYFCYVVVTRVVNSGGVAEKVSVTIENWDSPGQASYVTTVDVDLPVAASGTGGMAQCTSFGWLRPKVVAVSGTDVARDTYTVTLVTSAGTMTYTASNANGGALNLNSASATQVFMPLIEPAEFRNSALPWFSTRTTASGLLCTNVSQIQKKAGTVLCGRVAPQVINPFTVTSSYLNTLHPAEKAFLPLETGMYTYCPPSTDLADFWDFTVDSTTATTLLATSFVGVGLPCYRLNSTALVNVAFFTAGSDTEQLAVNVDWHIEFRTSSALFNIGLCGLTLETLHTAQLMLAEAGYFFDNPDHKPIIEKLISMGKKYGPTVVSAVSPAVGQILKSVMMSRKPNTTVPTTTAKASGLLGPPTKGGGKPHKQKGQSKGKNKKRK